MDGGGLRHMEQDGCELGQGRVGGRQHRQVPRRRIRERYHLGRGRFGGRNPDCLGQLVAWRCAYAYNRHFREQQRNALADFVRLADAQGRHYGLFDLALREQPERVEHRERDVSDGDDHHRQKRRALPQRVERRQRADGRRDDQCARRGRSCRVRFCAESVGVRRRCREIPRERDDRRRIPARSCAAAIQHRHDKIQHALFRRRNA